MSSFHSVSPSVSRSHLCVIMAVKTDSPLSIRYCEDLSLSQLWTSFKSSGNMAQAQSSAAMVLEISIVIPLRE